MHYGSNNGAGVVGTVNDNRDVKVPGIYAGFFVGDVRVTGTINGTTIGNSDIRYKENIIGLGNLSPRWCGLIVRTLHGRASVF